MSRFFSARYQGLEAYVPGEQPQDMAYIKLNTNESPYPPSARVLDAVSREAVSKLNLYPDPDCRLLTRAIAARYAVAPECVFLANGSDDILNFCFMGFCADGVIFPAVTYGFYEVYAKLYGLNYSKIPLSSDFSVDYRDYCGAGRSIVLANPNAQTGKVIPISQIEQIAASNPDHLVVVDEAYVDFGAQSCVPLTKRYENLLVCQTFSKSRSMAGARLGFAIASPALIADLNRLKFSTNPYNINRLTQLAGIAALEDGEYYDANCRKIIETRAYVRRELLARGFCVTDSSANFVLARSDRMDGQALYEALKRRGILVRHFSDARIRDCIRITIGTKQQMDALLRKIDEIMGGSI
ncbi:MAG: histidinol-phosphate transaminase [Clostridiales bacterium]|nr:histidinol-phosphate transaminase [Clostridiales bacterium]